MPFSGWPLPCSFQKRKITHPGTQGVRKQGVMTSFLKGQTRRLQVPTRTGPTQERTDSRPLCYPRLQIITFFRVSCRPSTKKEGIYLDKPGFPKSNPLLKKGSAFTMGDRSVFQQTPTQKRPGTWRLSSICLSPPGKNKHNSRSDKFPLKPTRENKKYIYIYI